MSEAENQKLWLLGSMRTLIVDGAAMGLKTPSVHIHLECSEVDRDLAKSMLEGLKNLSVFFGVKSRLDLDGLDCTNSVTLLNAWIDLTACALAECHPTLERNVSGAPILRMVDALFSRDFNHRKGILIVWPSYWPHILVEFLRTSIDAWEFFVVPSVNDKENVKFDKSSWESLKNKYRFKLPAGHNSALLLRAARELDIPVLFLDRDTMLIGQGRRGRLLRSTLTDETSAMGVSFARDKSSTSQLLDQSSIPVPEHFEATDVETATKIANRLGWPLVVKPADQDRGDGARANLRTIEQFREAYSQASIFSNRILIERHIEGKEYRLTVVNGELLWAHERVPAFVLGDGFHDLQTLVVLENEHRQELLQKNSVGYVPIKLDQHTKRYLKENGRSLSDVPAKGEYVRLQRIPAATTGGLGKACFDVIHPDNRVIAERAARVLRLNIAGIDLIISDISKSWREVGGAITEVNALPQLSVQTDQTLPKRLLRKILPHSGRIPTVFVLSEISRSEWLNDLKVQLRDAGLTVGISTEDGLEIAGNTLRFGRKSLKHDLRTLQIDPSVEIIIAVFDGSRLRGLGLPVDAVDVLVVESNDERSISKITKYVRGVKISNLDVGLDVTAWESWVDLKGNAKEITNVVRRVLLKAANFYEARKPNHT